jgi:predicted RNA binding protein YcfA (HicA-like mRNA interferase family)
MPRKIRQLVKDLKKAGFLDRGGKGSHRNFVVAGIRITISGHDGDDAQPWLEKAVSEALRQAQEKNR